MPQQTSASAAAPVIDLTDDDQQDGAEEEDEEVIPEIADGRVAPIEDLTQWLVRGRYECGWCDATTCLSLSMCVGLA